MTPGQIQAGWPDYYNLVSADAFTNESNSLNSLQAGDWVATQLYADLCNRSQVLAGWPPAFSPPRYVLPANFLALPRFQIPASIVLPPLTADLIALIIVVGGSQPTPAPVAPPPQAPAPQAPPPATPVQSLGLPDAHVATKPQAHDQGGGYPFLGGPASYCDLYSDDPLCDLWGGGGVTIVTGGGSTSVSSINVIQEGITSVDVDQIVTGSLSGLWAAAVSVIDAALLAVVQGIQAAITGIGNALKAAWAVLSRLSGFILSFLGTLWQDIVKGIIGALHDLRLLLGDLYNNILKPLAQAMAQVRNWILEQYKRWIRPLLIILQNIRRVLAILKLFHLKFASKLDSVIADVQLRLTQPMFWLLSYVNSIANWVNLIVTANYLLQKPLFLWSLKAYVGESLNMQINAMNPPIDPAALAASQAAGTVRTAAQSNAELTQFLTTRTGPMTNTIATYSPVLDNALKGGS